MDTIPGMKNLSALTMMITGMVTNVNARTAAMDP